MSRIRTIKPEFWTDDLIGSLSRETRLLFIGSWNLADDEGRLRWSAPYLKGAIFPFDDDLMIAEVEAMMVALQESGLVIAYTGGRSNQRLGFIRNFAKHQRINRPTPSKLPAPNGEQGNDNVGNETRISSLNDSVSGSLNDGHTPSLLEGEGEGEKEEEQEDCSLRSQSASAGASEGAIDLFGSKVADPKPAKIRLATDGNPILKTEDFDEFWRAFPEKIGRGNAESSFEKVIKLKAVSLAMLLAGLERAKINKPKERQWCAPAVWLNQSRWKDYDGASTTRWAQTA